MLLTQFDAGIRAGAAGTILLLAWLLLRHRARVGSAAILFAPLAVCVAGFVIGNSPMPSLVPNGIVGTVAHTVSGFTVIFLWWFCLSCFDNGFRVYGGVLGVSVMWAVVAAMDRGLFGDVVADRGLSRLLVPLGFAIVGHLVWRLLAGRRGDFIPQRHDARIMVAVLLGGMLFIDLAADALFGFAWRPLAFSMMQNAMVLAFGLWLASKVLSVRADVLTFGASENRVETAPQPDPGPKSELHRRLVVLMETERIFLDPELTFELFVKRMGAPERAVRTLINRELGYDHFRTFLNHARVAEARRLLARRDCTDKLITVALDSGFASLASFNRVFRAVEGCTPGAYRSAVREGKPADELRQTPGFEKQKAAF